MGRGRTVASGLGTGALPFATHKRWCLNMSVTYLYLVRNGHILPFQIRKKYLQRIITPPPNRLAGIPGLVSQHKSTFVVDLWRQNFEISTSAAKKVEIGAVWSDFECDGRISTFFARMSKSQNCDDMVLEVLV